MDRAELSFRLRGLARTQLQRASAFVRTPRWDRASLAGILTPAALDGAIGEAVTERNWPAAHAGLRDLFLSRRSTFVLNPGSAAALPRAILSRWPRAAFDAAARAERITAGDHDVLGYEGLRFDAASDAGSIDWHLDPVHGRRAPRSFWADVPYLDPRHGDHKIIWELNRHQHWLPLSRARWLTGDDRYASVIRRQLSGWLAANPPLMGVNWASMLELGFRSLSWLWAMHALLVHDAEPGAPWLVDMLIGVERQLRHVEENLSYYFSPNTHLTGEALALFVAGHALPELARSARWIEIGRTVLIREIGRQVTPDGGHAERSTHYHRYTLDFYLLALLTAEQAEDEEAAALFRHAVARLAHYLRAVAGADGTIPLIGDDDGGSMWPIAGREPSDVKDTLAVAAIALGEPALAPWGIPEEAMWLTWSTHAEEAQRLAAAAPAVSAAALVTTVFPDTGYVVVKDPPITELVFDVGPHGYLNGGHAHADALAVTLTVSGRPLLIDPGTATYTMNPALRDRMRSSVSHNTLTLDGLSSSLPAGPFHWRTSVDARLEAWRGNEGFAWAEGAHDGYSGAQHRRSIVQAAGGGTLIVDQVGGDAQRLAQLHWHFHPAWEVARASARHIRAQHADGLVAWMAYEGGTLSLVNGDEETGLGWCSPRYGAIVPTWAARVTRNGVAPFAMLTWVGTGEGAPSITRPQHEADPAGDALAVRVTQDALAWTTLLRPGEPAVRATRRCASSHYHTDARLLHYATRGDALLRLAAADITHALSLRDGLLSVSADGHVRDISIAVADAVLELSSSHILPELRLQGAMLAGITMARLNGRELPVLSRDRGESLVIATSAWADPRPGNADVTPRRQPEHAPHAEKLEARRILCAE